MDQCTFVFFKFTTINGPYSVISVISSVLNNDANLSAQKRNGLRSIQTLCETSFKKLAGDSCITCCTRNRVLIYSTKRLKKLRK